MHTTSAPRPRVLASLALLSLVPLARPWSGARATEAPRAEFLAGYGNDDVLPSPWRLANTLPIVFLPPERLAAGPPRSQQTANLFVPPGPPPRDGWPVAFMTLFGAGHATLPVDEVADGEATDRLWEALAHGLAVVNWGAPPVGDGRGMFYPPGHPSGRYESYAFEDDNSYKDAEWVLQYFRQPAQLDLYALDTTRFGVYGSSQSSQNLLWATMGPERARATGSAQVRTSTRVAAVVAVGTEGTFWAYDQGPTLGTNAPQLLERADMPGVPADELSQVDEELQKDASFTRWMTQTQDALDSNAHQPVCFLYVEPVKMVDGEVADTSFDAFGDPVLHDTIGQPYIHDSWNFIVQVNELLGISAASRDFHLTQGNSVFALEESVAATLSPPYDVYTRTYAGPLFGEEQTRIGIDFLREHLLLPLHGDAPLRVLFTDESEGTVDAWSWDFGDGTGAAEARPVHTYAAPGTYDVTLTVSGPLGTSQRTRTACVVVGGTVQDDLADGGFEAQLAGGIPAGPWQVQEGAGHVVRAGTDGAFPTEGAQWLDLSAEDTAGSSPPANPGGAGAPPRGGAGVAQSFTVRDGRTGLAFDAAFLRAGIAGDPADHDWASVDVGDGTTRWNLYLVDSDTPAPNTSVLHGLPLTDTASVRVDLAALFPDLDAEDVLTLWIEVGDGGDGTTPSRVYVDHLRTFVPAASVLRNGSGVNPVCFTDAGGPVLGGTWTWSVDTSAHAGATLAAVVGYDRPLPGLPTPFGELLVAPEPLGGVNLFVSVAPSAGGVASAALPVPSDPALEGLAMSTQAVVLGGGAALCNALDLTAGY